MERTQFNSELLQEIIDLAQSNSGHISYTVLLDMLKEAQSSLDTDSLNDAKELLRNSGITVDSESEDESYSEAELGTSGNLFIPADVNIISQTLSLDRLVDRIKHEEIDLHPDFQRADGIWSDEKQCRLIESLMLRIPLPAFYFDASNDDSWVVIDGLQRLTSVKRVILGSDPTNNTAKENKGKLRLKGLEYLTDFNGMTFDELPRQYQRRILEAQITVYVVQRSTPEEIVYNIFKRINTGGLNLTPQEIRHALYRGKATELAKDLSKTPAFIRATDHTISPDRMLDCEYITRYLAFTELDIETCYFDNIDNFLIEAIRKVNAYSDKRIEEIRSSFENVMNTAYAIFGRFTFRKLLSNERRGPVNKAIFELWCNCLNQMTQKEQEKLVERRVDVFNGFSELLQQSDFSSWIKNGNKKSMKQRISVTKKWLEGLLND